MMRHIPAKQQNRNSKYSTQWTFTRRRKFKEQLEIVRAKSDEKQILTKLESEKLFGSPIDRNKRNTLSQYRKRRFQSNCFAMSIVNRVTAKNGKKITRIANRNTAQE